MSYDLNHSALERWTRSETGAVDVATFVPAELVRYPTWDRVAGSQRNDSAYLYRPRGPGPHPVVNRHPRRPRVAGTRRLESVRTVPRQRARVRGDRTNVRGSSGYGKTFLKLDNGLLREDAVKDIGSLIVWLGLQPMFESRAHRGDGRLVRRLHGARIHGSLR